MSIMDPEFIQRMRRNDAREFSRDRQPYEYAWASLNAQYRVGFGWGGIIGALWVVAVMTIATAVSQ